MAKRIVATGWFGSASRCRHRSSGRAEPLRWRRSGGRSACGVPYLTAWTRKMAGRLRLLSALVGSMLAVTSAVSAAEPTCGGVAMPLRVFSSDGAMDAKIGVFVVDGSLFLDGKNTCQAVHIACFKETGSCETAIAVMIFEKDRYPRILGIFVSNEMKISRWTNDEIVAAGQTHLCKWSQLFVNYATNKIRL